jgi:Domain of unknown function (DUF4864)
MAIRILFLLATLLLLPVHPTRAQEPSGIDRPAIELTIKSQLEAFLADDGATAYGFASPTIKRIFPTVENFMAMVRRGYPQVYRPQQYKFGEIKLGPAGFPEQHVMIVGPDGKTYEAVYTMQRQPDGSWKINGCSIVELPGLEA